MSESIKILDTSTLSEVIKNRDEQVQQKAREYLATHQTFSFWILTRFEILRGLCAKNATRQIKQFDAFCLKSQILPLEEAVIVEAAEIYGALRSRGQLIDDIDILIAATARIHGLAVVTENLLHFHRIPDLQVEGWRSA